MNFQINNGVLEKYTGTTPDVIIPSCVTEIGKEAFKKNYYIKSVIITGNVTVIGNSAFEWCFNLEKIVIQEGVTTIGDSAFKWCDELEKIVIQEGVTTIGDSAFENCGNLEKIVIPEGITTIGDSAFENCGNLEKIVIPKSVTKIGDDAFQYTKWLTDKKASAKDAVIINGIAIAKADNIGDSVNLEGVKEIKEGVFNGCNNIKEFIISDGVKIGYNAFFTENYFNICLKSHIISVNIPVGNHYVEMIKKGYGRLHSFYKATYGLFDFIGADMEHKESLFNNIRIPEYRYPLAVFMANAYESEFFKTFIDIHLEKITEYAEKNAPDLLKFICGED